MIWTKEKIERRMAEIEAGKRTAEREDGFYWVKTALGWRVLLWELNSWSAPGDDEPYSHDHNWTVGPRLTPPEDE